MHRRRRNLLITLAVVAALLIALRAAAPTLIKDYINDQLQALENYDGAIEDVDLHIWRGASRIDGVKIVKTGGDQPLPFFSCDYIETSLDWRALFNGALALEGEVVRPDINIVKAKTKEESQTGLEEDWRKHIREMIPLEVRIEDFRVYDGRITFRAPGIGPGDELTAEHVNARVENLTNAADKDNHAQFAMTALVLEQAPLVINGVLDPLAKSPTFDVNMKLEQVKLQSLNPWLREYIKADAEAGTFQLYMELAAAEGKFKGYAKPLMQDVDMHRSEEPEENPLRRLWEGVVDLTVNVLENDKEDQVGARVPLSGTIKNPDAGVYETLVSVLRNAFVSAFARSLEGSITLRDVRDNLGDIAAQDKENPDEDRKRGKG